MPKKNHTPTAKTVRTRIIDTSVTLGLMVLALELLSLVWMSDVAFEASVYGPIPQKTSPTIEEPLKKAPSFTACERRAYRIPNAKRQQQVLALCHAREKNR